MTIMRVGNKEAALAGYQCRECSENVAARRKRGLKPLFLIDGQEGYKPHDVLLSASTSAAGAETSVGAHDSLHPEHHITMWRFDNTHPLSREEARQLRREGVTQAFAYRFKPA